LSECRLTAASAIESDFYTDLRNCLSPNSNKNDIKIAQRKGNGVRVNRCVLLVSIVVRRAPASMLYNQPLFVCAYNNTYSLRSLLKNFGAENPHVVLLY